MKYLNLTILALFLSISSFALGPITGRDSVCAGSTITLSNATPGGTWSSSIVPVASVGSATGLVTAGPVPTISTTIITYSVGGTSVTTTITVCPYPAAIGGIPSICPGTTITLSDMTPGGTWSQTNPPVASLSPSGVITGISAGTTVLIYTILPGCSTTASLTINAPTIYSFTGGGSYCSGGAGVPIGLNGSDIGIRYQLYLGASAVGPAVSGTGSAVSFGIFTIAAGPYVAVATNTVTGCTSNMSGSATVTINPLPYPYTCTGGGVFCAGAPGVWFYVNGSQPGVNYQLYNSSGPVGPPIPGFGSTINFDSVIAAGTYSVLATNATTGCINWMSDSVVVYINPALSPITGTTATCSGSTTQLSDATPGGVWSYSNAAIATIGSTGLVTTNIVSTTVQTTMTYSVSTGYGCVATTTITVNALPTVFSVTGGGSYPTGGSGILIGVAGSQIGVNYGLYIGSALAATLTGTGTAISFGPQTVAGTYTVIANNISTLCTNVMGSTTVTICTPPAAITGLNSVCQGSTIYLSDATTGGIWSSSNALIATIVPVAGIGVITGGSTSGTDTILYTLPSGCSTSMVLTVDSLPAPISATSFYVCPGNATVLGDITPTGTWSSSTPTIASIDAITAIVYGATTGTTTISYTLSSGCIATHTLTVIAGPATISGPASICNGSQATLNDATLGGTWSSSFPTIATIGSTSGIITGVSSGTISVIYALGTGCSTTYSVTVSSIPSPITGPDSMCVGSTISLSDATPGGAWFNSNPGVATMGLVTGSVTGTAPGTTIITDTFTTGCVATHTLTVSPIPAAITGTNSVCIGSTTTLSDAIGGGVWFSSTLAVATIDPSGTVTGVSSGTTLISYYITASCSVTTTVSVSPPSSVTISASPGDTVCAGTSVLFSAGISGGTPISYSWLVNGAVAGTGSTFSYTPANGDITECNVTNTNFCSGTTTTTLSNPISMVVNLLPAITATTSASCNGQYTLIAGGGTTYSWSPATGLSCSTCATATVNPLASVTYIVTGVTGSCSDTASVLVDGNRISGTINYTGVPTDTFKVWLINYNPTDSLILATDSTFSCMSGGAPYYQFTNEPPGSYMVKVELLSSVPGTSGYVPTYSLSSPTWNTAASAAHTTNTDVMNINMIYGTVPFGPGFIGGNVYSGAGRGTSVGIPAKGMLIFLEDSSGNPLTYTYTDTNGAYSFNWLAFDNYIIYPEDFKYYTTPSSIITLNTATPSATGVNFKQHTTYATITPYDSTASVKPLSDNAVLTIFPNPAKDNMTIQWQYQQTGSAGLTISDIVGREVFETTLNINAPNGQTQLNIADLAEGVYLITIKSGNIFYNSKLLIHK